MYFLNSLALAAGTVAEMDEDILSYCDEFVISWDFEPHPTCPVTAFAIAIVDEDFECEDNCDFDFEDVMETWQEDMEEMGPDFDYIHAQWD